MARLTAKQRKAIPKKDFGIPSKAPGSGSYPMPNDSHAKVATARASEMYNKGDMPLSVKKGIDAKADKMLGIKDGKAKAVKKK